MPVLPSILMDFPVNPAQPVNTVLGRPKLCVPQHTCELLTKQVSDLQTFIAVPRERQRETKERLAATRAHQGSFLARLPLHLGPCHAQHNVYFFPFLTALPCPRVLSCPVLFSGYTLSLSTLSLQAWPGQGASLPNSLFPVAPEDKTMRTCHLI